MLSANALRSSHAKSSSPFSSPPFGSFPGRKRRWAFSTPVTGRLCPRPPVRGLPPTLAIAIPALAACRTPPLLGGRVLRGLPRSLRVGTRRGASAAVLIGSLRFGVSHVVVHDVSVEHELVEQLLEREVLGDRCEDRAAKLGIERRSHCGHQSDAHQHGPNGPYPAAAGPASLGWRRRERLRKRGVHCSLRTPTKIYCHSQEVPCAVRDSNRRRRSQLRVELCAPLQSGFWHYNGDVIMPNALRDSRTNCRAVISGTNA